MTAQPGLLVRAAELAGFDGPVDVRMGGGRVVEVGRDLAAHGDVVLEARGGALVPGLRDHHLHLLALAAARASVRCGPPDVGDHHDLARALRTAPPTGGAGWVRGVGYHESVAGDLDAAALDAVVSDRPVRVQHRSGRLWVLNSAALAATGLDGRLSGGAPVDGVEVGADGRPTGRLYRADALLRDRLPPSPVDLGGVGRALAAVGVTAVTDATPDLAATAVGALAEAARRGDLPQRILLLGAVDAVPAPLAVGPRKLVLEEAVGLDLAHVSEQVAASHELGRAVAVHCVTVAEVVVAVEAIAAVGVAPGDRLEHASELPADLVARIASLGLRVVTQPGFVAERGDAYLAGSPVPAAELYRCATLLDEGIRVAGSTDAPFGRPDPWAAVRAARDRLTPDGSVLGPDERISAARALELFLAPLDDPGGPPAALVAGAAADCCLLAAPLAAVLRDPVAEAVRATVVAGRVVHGG